MSTLGPDVLGIFPDWTHTQYLWLYTAVPVMLL